MEKPEKYISVLLQQHDCVIIPEFGGFVLNPVPGRLSSSQSEVLPPSKSISFNRSLNLNDGLLANFIAHQESISYTEAISFIKNFTEDWKAGLGNNKRVALESIGSLYAAEEQKIIFEPDTKINYLKASYGLPMMQLAAIEQVNQQKIFVLPGIAEKEIKERNPSLVRSLRAASIAAVFVLGFFVVFKNISEKQLYSAEAGGQVNSIQPIASSMGNIISKQTVKQPATENSAAVLDIESSTISNTRFYVVGGSFKVKTNASNFVKELKEKGFQAQLLNTENGWYRVSYSSENDSLAADRELKTIKTSENQSAWLLKW